jgi:hypothetical protein
MGMRLQRLEPALRCRAARNSVKTTNAAQVSLASRIKALGELRRDEALARLKAKLGWLA